MDMLPFYLAMIISTSLIIEPLFMLLCMANMYTDAGISCDETAPTEEDSLSSLEGTVSQAQQVCYKRGVGNPNDFE